MPRRPPSAKLNKISVFIVYLNDSVICRQHICLIVNKSRKHVMFLPEKNYNLEENLKYEISQIMYNIFKTTI
jgi:hypothetical protein